MIDKSFQDIRVNVITRILKIIWFFAVIAIFFAVLQDIFSNEYRRILTVYIPTVLFLSAITYIKRIPFDIKSGTLLILFVVIGASELIYFGLASLGYMLFVVSVTLTGVFYGLKYGYYALTVTIMFILIVAYAYLTAQINITEVQQRASLDWKAWVSTLIVYIIVNITLMTTISLLIQDVLNLNSRIKNLIIQKNKEIAAAVEESSRNSSIISVQKSFLHVFHHLNTPLGNALAALSFSQDSAPEEKEKAVSLAKKSINQAINEIRSLQTSMGYLESLSMTEQIDIVDFIRSNEQVISMDYMADIFFEYYTADKIIRINPLTLLQVLNLLIKNSVDHADSPDLKIVISVDFEEPETLLISIEDNGKGIPEEHKEKIFEPFFTTSGISRIGLGLSIARKIVMEQFYGFLRYDETFTDGARFVIGIPVSY